MRSPAPTRALIDDEQRAALNRAYRARRTSRERAGAERRARQRDVRRGASPWPA